MNRKNHQDTMSYYSTLFQRYGVSDILLNDRTKKRAIGSILEQIDKKTINKNDKLDKARLKKLRHAFRNNSWLKKIAASLTFATALALFQAPPIEANIYEVPIKTKKNFVNVVVDDDSSIEALDNKKNILAKQDDKEISSLYFVSNKPLVNEFKILEENSILLDDDSDVAYTHKNISNHLTVIDTSIEDWQILAKSVNKGSVLLLQKGDNVLDSILAELKKLNSVESLNIISHGSSGELHILSKRISKETLQKNKAKWEELGTYLSKDGDINLFGCNIAKGDEGKEFLSTIAKYTDADVAASINPTGNNKSLGADWELEEIIGTVDKNQIFAQSDINQFNSVLAYSGTIDSNDGFTSTYSTANKEATLDIGSYKIFAKGVESYVNYQYVGNFIFGGGSSNSKIYLYFKTDPAGGASIFDVSQIIIGGNGSGCSRGSSSTNITITSDKGDISSTKSIDANYWASTTKQTFDLSSFTSGISKLTISGTNGVNCTAIESIAVANVQLAPSFDADGIITAGDGVDENTTINVPTTATTSANAVEVFDFAINDLGTSDGLDTTITSLDINVSGTNNSKLTYLLTNATSGTNQGSDLSSAITGTYNTGKVTFDLSSNNIVVTDGSSETYVVKAYYNDNTSITDNAAITISIDGDTDLTVSGSGSTMGTTSPITNSANTALSVTVTALNFTTQPAGSTSGSALTTQPVVSAVDSAGNVDTDFTEIISLTEASAGTLTNNTKAAVSGVATFSNLIYTATVDQQSFTLTANDVDGTGSDLATVDANAVTSDVVATKLIFTTQPAPTTISSGISTSFSTVPVVKAVDANDTVDTGYSTNIVLSVTDPNDGTIDGTVNSFSGTGDSDGSGTTVTLAPSSGVTTYTGLALQYTDSGISNTIALRATSGALSAVNSTSITTSDTTVPTVSSVSVPVNLTYSTGDTLNFTVNASENINVITTGGTPSIALTIGSTTKYATYVSGSGTSALIFRYTVESGLNDTDGITVGTLNLNGGTMKDSSGNNMTTTLNSVGNTSSVFVDSVAPTLSETTPVVTPTNDSTPSYTFSSNEAGTLNVGGSCGSSYEGAITSGTKTISLTQTDNSTALSDGTYSNCTITVTDSAGNASSALSITSFTVDTSGPTISTLSPLDNSTDIGTTANLVTTFSENISKGTGNIVIKKTSDNTVFETIAVTDSKVSISGSTLTINPDGTFDLNAGYYVQIASGAIVDSSGNSFAGISNTTSWNFTTVNNSTPTISGTNGGQTVNDTSGAITPFNAVTLADSDGDNISVTISLDDNAKGTLSSTSIPSGSISSVQAALRAITFTPARNRVVPGSSEATTISIRVDDGTVFTTDSSTTIISTSINDIPRDITLSSSSIDYDAGTNATVGTLNTSDADVSTGFTYTLVDKDSSANGSCSLDSDNSLFSISASDLLVLDPSFMEGAYSICVQTNDGFTTFQKTLSVNVGGKNEPVIDSLTVSNLNDTAVDTNNNIIVYKNYGTRTITINASDADLDPLTYDVFFSDDSIFTTKSLAGNILTLASAPDTSGNSDITITVNDGTDTISKTFNFRILTFNDGDNVNENGSVSIVTDEKGDEVTTIDVPDDNLVVKKTVKSDGSTEQSIIIDGIESKVISGSPSSQIEITNEGVTTSFSSNGINANADTTVLGKTTHRLILNGQTTQAISNVLGSTTTISEDGSGNPQIVTTVANIEVDAKPDGSAVHIVTNGSTSSKTTSSILGANTVINSEEVETSAGIIPSGSRIIKAKSITKTDGTTVTRFVAVDDDNNETVLGTTLRDGSVFDNGNTVEIYEDNGAIFMKVTAPLSTDLVVE
ncbi:DUF4347 domain-containing protein [Campylobacterota bacterium DY0563]